MELAPGSLWPSAHAPFPVADFALNPFATNPDSRGDNYTLSTESSQQVIKLGGGLRNAEDAEYSPKIHFFFK